MSQENVELLRRGFEHVERTREFLPEAAHTDFVWDTTTFRGGVQLASCVGIDETNRRANAKHGGPEVEMRLAQVWTFRDGLIARMEMYADRDEALRAAGLPG